MVKHYVMWKIVDKDGKSAAENVAEIKAGLEALVGVIPGLLKAEVSLGYSEAYNAMLYSEFESKEALADYRVHPAHKAVQKIVHNAMEQRASFDVEV